MGGGVVIGRVNYVVSLVSLTSLLDRRSEDLGEETTVKRCIMLKTPTLPFPPHCFHWGHNLQDGGPVSS